MSPLPPPRPQRSRVSTLIGQAIGWAIVAVVIIVVVALVFRFVRWAVLG